LVYLHRDSYRPLVARGLKIMAAYFVVSVPVAMGMAVLGREREPIGQVVFNVLTFQFEPTAITILKFYGIMFLLLPLILPVFKRHKLPVLVVSALFRGFHLGCGDEGRRVRESGPDAAAFLAPGAALPHARSLARRPPQIEAFDRLPVLCGHGRDLSVRSARLLSRVSQRRRQISLQFDKLINLLWTLPVLLAMLWAAFAWMKNWPATGLVLNVGRNSLIAFLASEVVVRPSWVCSTSSSSP
jgi:hypothetical protein